MTTSASGEFPIFDGDSHVLESRAIWTEYVDERYRVPARLAFCREEHEFGIRTVLNGKLIPEPTQSRIPRDAVWQPGMTPDTIAQLDPESNCPVSPGAGDAGPRLHHMDAMGIDQALVFPTLFAEYLPEVDSPEVAWALARGYNDWIHDFCSVSPDRLFPAAVIPLQEIGFAVEELRRAAGLGFKAAFIRPAFYGKIYVNHAIHNSRIFINHPYYDPLWRELEKLGVAAAIHPTPGSANEEWFSNGAHVERVSMNWGIGHPVARTNAPAMDNQLALLTMLAHAHFDRFPDLRVSFLHSRGGWLPLALEKSEGYLVLHGRSMIPVRPRSSEVWAERNGTIGIDADEMPVHQLLDEFEDKAIWGSRYPQHDTTAAHEAIRQLSDGGVPAAAIAKMMGENAARTYRIAPKRFVTRRTNGHQVAAAGRTIEN